MTNTAYCRLKRVLMYIHNNLDRSLLVDEIANAAHCSRWQAQRDFAQATDLSIATYVRSLRLSKAATMLVETNLRQIDIVDQCGFESEMSFHRGFKRYFGCTPGNYRKRGNLIGIQHRLNESSIKVPN